MSRAYGRMIVDTLLVSSILHEIVDLRPHPGIYRHF
jgi:hypothetical protein